jgi:hypothetical protein
MVDKLLDDKEVKRLAGPDSKVITYPELQNYHDIDHLFGKDNKVIILYLNSKEGGNFVGHWTLLMRNRRKGGKLHIEFNDSYANEIDEYFDQFPPELREQLDQSRGYLSRLLYDYCHTHPQSEVEYNEIPLQKLKDGINTCGRWVGVRAHFADVPLEEWQEAFKKLKRQGYDLDKVITNVSNILLRRK